MKRMKSCVSCRTRTWPYLLAGSFFFLSLVGTLSAEPACFPDHASEKKWNQWCYPSEGSFGIRFRNVCHKPQKIKVCIESQGGKWNCFINWNVPPGGYSVNSWGNYACDATGNYWWEAKDINDRTPFSGP